VKGLHRRRRFDSRGTLDRQPLAQPGQIQVMTNATTVILAPFLFAFLMFVARFYFKEGANSKLRPSFILAVATVAITAVYLGLCVTDRLPDYGAIGFASAGLALMALSIYRIFLI
jgi:hypothetical protein